MRPGRNARFFSAFIIVGLAACAQEGEREPAMQQEAAGGGMEAMRAQVYPNAPAEVVLENDRMVVQRTGSRPGQWVGEHSHTGSQLAVLLKGGTVTYREGGEDTEVTYEPGDVIWVEPTEAHDHTSDSGIEAILITLTGTDAMARGGQSYPNLESEVVFENDRVIAQRAVAEPGQWAGKHSHTGTQLAVVLNGGTLTYRDASGEVAVTYEDGEVFLIEPTQEHDHASTSDSRFDAILVTIK